MKGRSLLGLTALLVATSVVGLPSSNMFRCPAMYCFRVLDPIQRAVDQLKNNQKPLEISDEMVDQMCPQIPNITVCLDDLKNDYSCQRRGWGTIREARGVISAIEYACSEAGRTAIRRANGATCSQIDRTTFRDCMRQTSFSGYCQSRYSRDYCRFLDIEIYCGPDVAQLAKDLFVRYNQVYRPLLPPYSECFNRSIATGN